MKISVAPNGSQYPYIYKEDKLDNKTRIVEEKAKGIQLATTDGLLSNGNTIQAANNALLKLMHNARMINKTLDENPSLESDSVVQNGLSNRNSFPLEDVAKMTEVVVEKFPQQELNVDFEEIAITMVESVNEVLRIVNEIIDTDVPQGGNPQVNNNGLEKLKEIIVSALKVTNTIHEMPIDISLQSIKFVPEELFGVDHQSLKEAISSNTVEASQTIKTFARALVETLPLCIDPNSGALVYTGKRLEDEGEGKASKILAAVDEELEKERTELDKRLNVVESLMSYSNKLITDLKIQPEALITEE
jgi:hypothetical protein